MKLSKLSAILLLLFIPAPFYFAQEKPQAVLLNEVGKDNCEWLKAITDSFIVEISYEPEARGLIVIHPDKKSTQFAVWQEQIINFRAYNIERLKIVRAAPQDVYRIEFWRVPAGADTPDFKAADWNTPSPDFSKPYLYGSADELDICPTFIAEIYTDILKQNPNVRGRIIVKEPKILFGLNRSAVLEEWITPLTEKFKLPRSRFKLTFAKSKEGLLNVEYWIVPVKEIRRP